MFDVNQDYQFAFLSDFRNGNVEKTYRYGTVLEVDMPLVKILENGKEAIISVSNLLFIGAVPQPQ